MSETKTQWQLIKAVTLLRILIGWHFLYEGVVKLYNPDWTSFGYLASATGPLQSIFQVLTTEAVQGWVDTLNMLALIFVGIALILGIFERWGAIVGMALLALYYLAHPPFPGLPQINVEGNYWFVNKNLIELAACWVIYRFPTGHFFGLNYFFKKQREQKLNDKRV